MSSTSMEQPREEQLKCKQLSKGIQFGLVQLLGTCYQYPTHIRTHTHLFEILTFLIHNWIFK